MLIFIKMKNDMSEKQLRMRTLECLSNANQSLLYHKKVGGEFELIAINENLRKYEKDYRPRMVEEGMDTSEYDEKFEGIKRKLTHQNKSRKQTEI